MLIFSTLRKLKTHFLIGYLLLITVGVFTFATTLPFSKLSDSVSINLQQLLILCLLGGIPGALVWTRNKIKTLTELKDIAKRLKRYEYFVRVRQTIFFVLGFFILFLHTFTRMNGAFMLFMVVVLLCMFIVPTRGRLETEAHLTEPED